MFTGLVEALGVVKSCRALPKRKTLVFEIETVCFSKKLTSGKSLSVNGVCLTVVKRKGDRLYFNMVGETKKRSTLSSLKTGTLVNLERPLKFNGRMDGHFVLGHIDAVGRIERVQTKGSEKSFLIGFPKTLERFIYEKGSIALDGVSMTIGRIEKRAFWVHSIPHTLKITNFKNYRLKTLVNLETDILAKMAARRKSIDNRR